MIGEKLQPMGLEPRDATTHYHNLKPCTIVTTKPQGPTGSQPFTDLPVQGTMQEPLITQIVPQICIIAYCAHIQYNYGYWICHHINHFINIFLSIGCSWIRHYYTCCMHCIYTYCTTHNIYHTYIHAYLRSSVNVWVSPFNISIWMMTYHMLNGKELKELLPYPYSYYITSSTYNFSSI